MNFQGWFCYHGHITDEAPEEQGEEELAQALGSGRLWGWVMSPSPLTPSATNTNAQMEGARGY